MRDERHTRERDEDNANHVRQGGTCRRAAHEERRRGDMGLNPFTLNPNPFRRDGSESDNNDKSEEQTDGSESQCQSLLAILDDFEGQLFFYEEYDDSFSQGHGYSGPPVFDSDTSENKLGDAFFGDYIGTQIYDEEIVLQSDDPIFYKEIGDTCVEVFHGSCDVGEEYETEPVYDEDGEGKQEEEVEVEFNQLHACTVKSAMHLMDADHSREVKSLLTEFPEVTSQSKTLPSLLTEFPEVTSQSKTLCPQCKFDHRIRLINETKLVNVAPYRYAHFQKDEIERPIEEMLYTGLLRHNMSPFLSPMLLVKKDDIWRFCTNYRALNAATVKDRFHIPTVDDMLGELRGARDFSKLDLRAGYHQIHMHPDGIHKTAFRTHIENTIAKIIWDEVGESEAERDRALAELERECSEVFRRKVGQANRCRAQLRQAIADAEAELAAICSAMGELPVHIRQSDQIPQSLKAELRTILPQIEEMRKREVDRKNQFIQILREIQSIKNETGRSDPLGSNELAIDKADLSANKLEELQAHKEKSKHLKMTLHRLNCLYSLCIVLGLDCKKIVYKIHPSLVEAESSKNISNSTIEQLGTAIQELGELKIQRMQQLQNLANYWSSGT